MPHPIRTLALAILLGLAVGCPADDAGDPSRAVATTQHEVEGWRSVPQPATANPMEPAHTGAVSSPPNFVLIVVDTLRADHLAHYGYERDTTRHLDGLRRRATIFDNAYSTAPWTGPSTISIHTGLSTIRHGANAHGDRIPDEAITLAEYLSDAGYATHGISFNPNVSRKTGFDAGFDVFDDAHRSSTSYPDISQMTQKVYEWAEAAPTQPFFLYLHPMNVHGPYRVPPPRQADLLGTPPSREFKYYDGEVMHPLMRDPERDKDALRASVSPAYLQSLIDQYDTAVRYSMDQIAFMIGILAERGLLENTVLILTSDHGEELFDHGGFSHGYSLYRELLHVPLYLHLPGQTTPGKRDHLVSTIDILPTVLELADIEPRATPDGISLLTPSDLVPGDRLIIQQTSWPKRAVGLSAIRGRHHFIDLERSYDHPEPSIRLFDLGADHAEQHDLAAVRPEQITELRGTLTTRIEALAHQQRLDAPRNVLGQMDMEQLRALGYVE
ncbi:MAG TPA: sulfatase [Myxococcota bacterium]|nr:sulfatase [Myxococcales bacterium]HPG25831.1 sulfatase [Myxococcota bacterium]